MGRMPDAVAEPAGVLLLELPQRDLGGQQPSWEQLQEQVDWAHCRGAAEAAATPDPAIQRVELSVGDATCALKPG